MTISESLAYASLAILLPILQAEPHCPGNVGSLRLRLVQRSQIIVPVQINSTGPYDFLVDTGAQISTVDPSLASELHLKVLGTTGVVGVASQARTSLAQLDLLEAGPEAMTNLYVVVQNLSSLQAADRNIRGILGGNFLRQFDLLIDYPHSMLCLDDKKAMQPKVKGDHVALISVPPPNSGTLSTEPLVVEANLSGASVHKKRLLLDSGSNVPLLYDAGPVVRQIAGTAPLHNRSADGVDQAFAVLPAQDIEIGRHAFHQIAFVTPISARKELPKVAVDGLLPTILFQRVYISYADRFAVLDPW